MKKPIQTSKAQDSRVRRWAQRLGFRLEKSRAKRATYYDHGLYMLMHTDRNSVVAGDRFTARLEDIEAYLADEERRRAGPAADQRKRARPRRGAGDPREY